MKMYIYLGMCLTLMYPQKNAQPPPGFSSLKGSELSTFFFFMTLEPRVE